MWLPGWEFGVHVQPFVNECSCVCFKGVGKDGVCGLVGSSARTFYAKCVNLV